MVTDVGDGTGQVLVGIAGTIDERKGVVAQLREFKGMGERVVHGSHVGEAAACIANGKRRTFPLALWRGGQGVRLEEEQPSVAQIRISLLFFLSVDVYETVVGVGAEIIAHLYRLVGIDVVIPRQLELFERRAAPLARIHREYQSSVIAKGRVVHHVADSALAVVKSIHRFRNYRYFFCLA